MKSLLFVKGIVIGNVIKPHYTINSLFCYKDVTQIYTINNGFSIKDFNNQ